ncbi:hypothetical protein SAY86_008330 [Trapa natans]|uniref:Uncharacterized protein n=1 Tax=Trapa natans TaxID=22666 RepID=A0AAN7KF54_TRANT|nr:hypothetical protein SAY86_008330 [Trapa natans]
MLAIIYDLIGFPCSTCFSGWHICTSCQKKAHYMCYTCPHSLCKSCYRRADFICIRENKGLCSTCRGTIMLIENVKEGNKDMVQVDFDDQSSWEYLFKVYWTDLKAKLSMTVDEITQAQNLRKERKIKCKRSIEKLSNGYAKSDFGTMGNHRSSYLHGSSGWASNELLEFVGYMKGGDMPALSQFEVQALLLEYVDRNNLRDPKEKWEIFCDIRLGKLFGRVSLDHFEMLKLLDSHFLVKEIPQLDEAVRVTNFDGISGLMDIDLNKSEHPMVCNDKMLESFERLDEKENHIDQDDYAMLDSQRISSIYLRRSLIENLIDDVEQFKRKAVGSVVRIRISCQDDKQNMHRLVQVAGTSKAIELYKIGDKYTNIKLEILNVDRKEVIPIHEISDHDFSEEECRQFVQNVTSGKVKWFSTDVIQLKGPRVKAEQVNYISSYQQPEIVNEHLLNKRSENSRISSWITGSSHADAVSSVTKEVLSGIGSEISPSPLSTATEQSVNDDETCKIWHYQDSNGKVQGPFTMIQMRKWQTLGDFHHNQRIWRTDQKYEDSILLSNALEGHFLKESALHSREDVKHSDDRDSSLDGISSISVNTNGTKSELGSHYSCDNIKSEKNIEKECRYFSGQIVGPSEMLLGANQGQEFDHSKVMLSHRHIGVGQIHDASIGKVYDGKGHFSAQSIRQNWKASSLVGSSPNEYPGGSLVNSLLTTPQKTKGIETTFPALLGPAQKPAFENFRSPDVCIGDSAHSWISTSSIVDGKMANNKVVNRECDSNVVSASQKLTEICNMDGSTSLTLGSVQLLPPPFVLGPLSWQSMVSEPVELTPLPEESVSDLLAELEASEPFNGSFSSLSPKNFDGSRGKTDYYSNEAGFFSESQPGRGDCVSSFCTFPIPSPAVTTEPQGSYYFNPQDMKRIIFPENSSPMTLDYRNGYPENGQVSWFSPLERNPEMWEKQLPQQQQKAQYYAGNRNSSPKDQLFSGLNLDLSRGRSVWDIQ